MTTESKDGTFQKKETRIIYNPSHLDNMILLDSIQQSLNPHLPFTEHQAMTFVLDLLFHVEDSIFKDLEWLCKQGAPCVGLIKCV